MAGCAASENGSSNAIAVTDTTSVIQDYEPRFGREKPVIAVIGENRFTELTDYVVPYGILAAAGIADVFALSTKEGPIQMFPALKIQPENTAAGFDSLYPDGADYVIVPAVHHSDDPDLLNWVSEQAEKGATIVGICDGVWVVANSGLLDGKKAVGHWYSLKNLGKKFPDTEWVRNRRYLADGKIITTTGVTASVPVSLALVEAIGGKERARRVSEMMGASGWSPEHSSSDFRLKGGDIVTGAKNWISFWSHEEIGVPVFDGINETGLALLADAYSRTFRSKAYSVSSADKAVKSAQGLMILPDRVGNDDPNVDHLLEPLDERKPVHILEETLNEIEHRYGRRTADFVALQLEYSQL